MNPHFENETGERKNILSKIKQNYSSKFSNLSLSSTLPNIAAYSDHDGSTEEDTLIHNAFVKYFDSKAEQYPEWLGVKVQQSLAGRSGSNSGQYQNSQYQNSQYQPVYSSYNTPPSQSGRTNSGSDNSSGRGGSTEAQTTSDQQVDSALRRPLYTPRSSSRLQDMYNKSRQQVAPGSGYNAQSYQTAPARSNSSSVTGSRLRERVLNTSPSLNNIHSARNGANNSSESFGNGRATWGRR